MRRCALPIAILSVALPAQVLAGPIKLRAGNGSSTSVGNGGAQGGGTNNAGGNGGSNAGGNGGSNAGGNGGSNAGGNSGSNAGGNSGNHGAGGATNAGSVAASTVGCGANCVDLTTKGASGSVGGAIFTQIDPQPTGTGYIDPFLRVQSTGVQTHTEGYNTSTRPFQPTYDQKNPLNYTHDLLTDDVPVVIVDGIAYRQFFLDINESHNHAESLLSLDQLQIFQSSSGGAHDYPNDLGTLIYDLDASGDHWILLEYALNHGSGSGDMSALIPNTLFVDLPYTYLYSRFGDTNSVSAGFEEWWTGPADVPTVPEPATFSLLGAAGVAALIRYRRRARGRAVK
jgi:hypothetical protein